MAFLAVSLVGTARRVEWEWPPLPSYLASCTSSVPARTAFHSPRVWSITFIRKDQSPYFVRVAPPTSCTVRSAVRLSRAHRLHRSRPGSVALWWRPGFASRLRHPSRIDEHHGSNTTCWCLILEPTHAIACNSHRNHSRAPCEHTIHCPKNQDQNRDFVLLNCRTFSGFFFSTSWVPIRCNWNNITF